ncbi:unnamed protein product [Darwinula stevensoni]|uniref:Glutaredoxin domain-containing protein n=1 Tax=Darwinula stevensoni TaxID=69355 RepID=A0A7R8WZS5_9CRUS|nr:unnamed protein product [Darwinula stevensoni]CAG0880457.1 unnamed protein product [Darwinula stevensoni]
MEKEAGKVVVYTTNLGVIRRTYQECMKVKNILRTLLVKFEERDIYLNPEVQTELRERLEIPDSNSISVPHVYVEGQWLAVRSIHSFSLSSFLLDGI